MLISKQFKYFVSTIKNFFKNRSDLPQGLQSHREIFFSPKSNPLWHWFFNLFNHLQQNILIKRYWSLAHHILTRTICTNKMLHRSKTKRNFVSWQGWRATDELRSTIWKLKRRKPKHKPPQPRKSTWLVTCWPCSLCWSCILSCLGVFVRGLMMLALGCIPWRGKLPCWFTWLIMELKDGDCPWRLKPPCSGGPCAGYVGPYKAAFWSIITAASWPWKTSCLGSKACPLNIKHINEPWSTSGKTTNQML